jgi:hypothetical protein
MYAAEAQLYAKPPPVLPHTGIPVTVRDGQIREPKTYQFIKNVSVPKGGF